MLKQEEHDGESEDYEKLVHTVLLAQLEETQVEVCPSQSSFDNSEAHLSKLAA